jgi:hypothetical protein
MRHSEILQVGNDTVSLFTSSLETTDRMEVILELLGSRVSKMIHQLLVRDHFIQELQRSTLHRSDRSITWTKVMGDLRRLGEVHAHQPERSERDPRHDVLADIVSLRKTVDILKESIAIHEATILQLITRRGASSCRSCLESFHHFLADPAAQYAARTGAACHQIFAEQETLVSHEALP